VTALERLDDVVRLFATAPAPLRLEALLDYSRRLPPLPERLAGHPELLQRVPECQTPFFLTVEIEDGQTHLFFEAPPESPTVRGYAGILHEALEGAAPAEILAVPNDFYLHMGLQEAVSPLRLRGMGAIVQHLKAKVREATGAA
jgi:cysteine desulfuration protein SufE